MACECNSSLVYVDAKIGAALNVASAARKVACAGAKPLAISDCLNFGNPQNPEVMWQFAKSCEGIKEACERLNTPVASGNVSLYNETEGVSIYPSPTIVCVGLNSNENKGIKSHIDEAGLKIYLLGDTREDFSASLAAKVQDNVVAGELRELEYEKELALLELLQKANEKSLLKCANNVGLGGLAISLAKIFAHSAVGCELDANFKDEALLFSESASRVVVALKDEEEFLKLCADLDIKATFLGQSVDKNTFKLDSIELPLNELKKVYFESFRKLL